MGPNKLETQIKEQLNAREIKPSEMAWDRLDAMLSVAEEKKTKRSFGWWYIAASILVLVTAGMFFINQKNTEIKPENSVVVNEESKNKASVKEEDSINSNTGNDYNFPNAKVKNQIARENKSSAIEQSSKKSNQNSQKTNANPLLIQNQEIKYQNPEIIAQKEMPKVVSQKKVQGSKSTYVNVDELLASVEKEPTSKKKNPIKVNVNSLLSQVDVELEMTFREKMIQKLGKNYQQVKVALANRNQETNSEVETPKKY